MQIHSVINSVPSLADHTLHDVMSDLIDEAAALAIHNRNYVVNNIPLDLYIEANETIVSSVLSQLFQTNLRHTQNSVILISAKVYGHVVLVQLKTKGIVSPALPEDIGNACISAQKTGGVIELTQYDYEQAAVAYCFLNVAAKA